MANLLDVTFESGSDGATVDPVAEGFDSSSGLCTYVALNAAHGQYSARVEPGGSVGYLQWNAGGYLSGDVWGRAYVQVASMPGNWTHLIGFFDAGLQKASIVLTSDGRIALRNSSTNLDRVTSAAGLWSATSWVRLEWRINWSTNEFEAWLYSTDPDGTVEDAHIVIPTADGIPQWQFLRFGTSAGTGSGSTVGVLYDALAVSQDGKIGPAPVDPTPVPALVWMWIGGVNSTSAQVAFRLAGVDTGQVVYAVDPGTGDPLTGSPTGTPTLVLDAQGIGKLALSDLTPDTDYVYGIIANGTLLADRGHFTTMPHGQADFTVAFSSAQAAASDHVVFDRLRTEDPRVFFHLGDLYPSPVATNDLSAARAKYDGQLQAGTGRFKNLLKDVPTDYVWGTTDWGGPDSWGDYPAAPALLSAYQQYVPQYPLVDANSALYHAVAIGRVQFLVLDVRSRRSAGTLLGVDQKEWLKAQLSSSIYPVSVIVCPIPWRAGTEWDAASAELAEINGYITDNAIANVAMIGAAHALAADSGAHSSIGRANLLAGALDGAGVAAADTWDHGDNANAAGAGQYALLSVVDTGAQITITYSGRNQAGTVLVGPYDVVFTIGGGAPPETKIWNGTAWVHFRPRVYLDGAWKNVPVKVFNGSTWLTF